MRAERVVLPRQPEVGELDLAAAAEQDVGALKVAVQQAARVVHVGQAFKDGAQQVFDVALGQRDLWAQHAGQVVFQVLEDQVDRGQGGFGGFLCGLGDFLGDFTRLTVFWDLIKFILKFSVWWLRYFY